MLTRTLPAFAVFAAVGAAALSGVVWFLVFGGVSSATPFAPVAPSLEVPAAAESPATLELEASSSRTAATVTIDVAVTPAGTPDVVAEVTPGDETSELLELRREVSRLRARVEWLEIELELCGSEVTKGPVARWLATIDEAERPTVDERRRMAEALARYPVELTPSEGLWILERIRAKDWKTYGPTVDEALILFLGPARLMRELDPVSADALRAEWAGDGYFD